MCPATSAMKRGQLSPIQIEPRRYCPGDQLVLCAQQTDDLAVHHPRFQRPRARAKAPAASPWNRARKAGSFARTVHYFNKVSGDKFWKGGIAYAGDLSVYPDKG